MTPSVVVKVPRKFHGQEYHDTTIDNRRERLLYYVACVDAVEAPGGFTPKAPQYLRPPVVIDYSFTLILDGGYLCVSLGLGDL